MLEETGALGEAVSFEEEFNAEDKLLDLDYFAIFQVEEVKGIHCIAKGELQLGLQVVQESLHLLIRRHRYLIPGSFGARDTP